jgi:hypothetical protein
MNSVGFPDQWAPDDEQFGIRGGGHQRLHAVEPCIRSDSLRLPQVVFKRVGSNSACGSAIATHA